MLAEVVKKLCGCSCITTYSDLKAGNQALFELLRHSVLLPAMLTSRLAPQHGLLLVHRGKPVRHSIFGPVADKGLDPNMDSWPLDQDGIVQILTSGNYSDLNWDGDYDEEDDKIAGAQALRGYHTLEYLIFKDGEARTIQ